MHPKYWKSGRKAVYYKPLESEGSAGGSYDANDAGAALASLLGGDEGQAESAAHEAAETPEAAAERLAAQEAGANHEADADSEQGDTPEEAETVTVMIDGKPVELTKEQIAEAHKGQLRQADYTRKTQEAAEIRKAADAEKAQATAEREQYARNLQNLLAANQHHEAQAKKWTAEDIDADPIGFLQHQEDARARAQQTQAAYAELQQIEQQRQQEQAQSQAEFFAKQREALVKANPELADDAKWKAHFTELEPFFIERGFSKDDGQYVFDARFITLLQDAKKYKDLMTRAQSTAQKVAKAPPRVEAPGRQPVAPTDGRTVAMKRLSTSGSVNDAADVLARLL